MNDIRKEYLDVVEALRAHLEYRRALGVRGVAKGRPAPDDGENSQREEAGMSARVPDATRTVSAETLKDIRTDIGECARCKLHRGRKTIVFGEGNPKAQVVFVGEGPGYEEDQQGRPFVGAAGQLLTDIIVKGMKLKREDVYICNIVKCRPPNNRNPEPEEVESCIGFVQRQIAAIGPKVIVTLGNVPTQNLLDTKEGITRLRGRWQEYKGIPVMPTFHPSYLLRSPSAKKEVWIDIKKVLARLGMPIVAKESGAGN